MQTARIWKLLSAGGLDLRSPATPGQAQTAVAVPTYNGLVDPAGAEELGSQLAERARELQPSLVLLWEHPQDVVLGHIVARELRVPALRSYDQEGLVGLAGALPAGSRVLIVSDAFRDPGVVTAMQNVIESHAGTLVGAAVLVETDALRSVGGSVPRIVRLVSDDQPLEGDSD